MKYPELLDEVSGIERLDARNQTGPFRLTSREWFCLMLQALMLGAAMVLFLICL